MARGDASFGRVESRREFRQLGEFVADHPGDYDEQRHRSWAYDVCIPAVERGERPGYGFWLQHELRGGLILKPIEELPKVGGLPMVEAKYVRVDAPDFSRRGAGAMLMYQVPVLAQESLEQQGQLTADVNRFTVQLDTRAESPAQSFFERFGFRVVEAAPLYDANVLDVVMERTYQVR